jgi:hypothetical protein
MGHPSLESLRRIIPRPKDMPPPPPPDKSAEELSAEKELQAVALRLERLRSDLEQLVESERRSAGWPRPLTPLGLVGGLAGVALGGAGGAVLGALVGGILVGSLIFLAMILTIGIAALLFAVGLMGLLISGLFGSRDDWTENLLGPGCLTLLITLPLLYGLVWLAERLGPRSIPLVDPTAAHLIRWLNLGNSEWAFPALRATLAITGLIGLGAGGVLGAWGGFHLGRHWPGLTLLGLVGMVPLTMFAYPRMNRPFLDGTVPGITRGISMPSSGASSSSSRGASSSPAGSPTIPLACVKGDQGLRASPGGAVQSRVAHGTPVWILEEGQAWSRVRTPGGAVGHLPAKALERAPRTDRPLTCVRATERLRLREGPGTGHRILERLKPATPLEVLTREGNWIRVRTPEGKTGFVDAQWVFWPPLDPTSTP